MLTELTEQEVDDIKAKYMAYMKSNLEPSKWHIISHKIDLIFGAIFLVIAGASIAIQNYDWGGGFLFAGVIFILCNENYHKKRLDRYCASIDYLGDRVFALFKFYSPLMNTIDDVVKRAEIAQAYAGILEVFAEEDLKDVEAIYNIKQEQNKGTPIEIAAQNHGFSVPTYYRRYKTLKKRFSNFENKFFKF